MRSPLLGSVFLIALLVPTFGYAWTCGDALIDERDTQSYTTVLIGNQCWMAQNLNIGTKIASCATTSGHNSVCTAVSDVVQNQGNDCATIQKFCYSDDENNCATYGALYQWHQAMCGATDAGVVGICPSGWHIPTHNEWTTLERTVCTSVTCATDFPYDTTTSGIRGTNEGSFLRTVSASHFSALLSGFRDINGSFITNGTFFFFWSSLRVDNAIWRRYGRSTHTAITRATTIESNYGFSIRCLQNPFTVTNLTASAVTSVYGQTMTLIATVSPSSAAGTVTFYRGSDALGTAVLGHGSGSLIVDSLAVGTHSITASYGGDEYYPGSTSTAVQHTVQPPPPSPGGGRGSRSPGRGGDAPQIDGARRVVLPQQAETVSPLYGPNQVPPAPAGIISPLRDRLAARIEKRITQYPRLRTTLLHMLERLDRRLLPLR